ncbi:MAG TPA: transcriptional regulator [Xanthomarina gelatinilytica]|uniref:Transcriptional regulator n=1 Tax=Xanthomarina gelatinilytica TaxID=1137281 RepID=A0A3D6BQR2_9FLAO|nr:transcriptional regulator [Xanthomarina gelatinilytica]
MEPQLKSHIRDWRKSKRFTQSDLAKKVGITRQSLSAIENERTIPSLKVALKLSSIFETEVNELFTLKTSE